MKFLDRLRIGSVFRNIERVWLTWAMREIHPLHPDVPGIVRRLNELESAL